jgi:hypothetical protein
LQSPMRPVKTRSPGWGEAESQKAPMTGKFAAHPAGWPGSSYAWANLRRFLLRLTPFAYTGKPEVLSMRFLRNAESICPMRGPRPSLNWNNDLPPIDSNPSPRTRREDRILPIVQMSSGRLFLDRVARQHCPSPLHRRDQINTHFFLARQKGTFLLCTEGDISTLR